MVTQQESRKFSHACDLQLIFANKGKGNSRSFQQTFVGEECVTSQKNVCVGGYRIRRSYKKKECIALI